MKNNIKNKYVYPYLHPKSWRATDSSSALFFLPKPEGGNSVEEPKSADPPERVEDTHHDIDANCAYRRF